MKKHTITVDTDDFTVEKVEKEFEENKYNKSTKVNKLFYNPVPNLAVRKEASKYSDIVRIANGGEFTVTEMKNGYGKIKDGWISLAVVKEVKQ